MVTIDGYKKGVNESIINKCVDICLRKYLNEKYNTNNRQKISNVKLLESQQSNLNGFLTDLKKIFDVKLDNYCYYGKEGRFMAYITTDTFDINNNDFKTLMDKHQVFISEIDEFDAIPGTIRVNFESSYPQDVTKNVYRNSNVLYHLTRTTHISEIVKNGLIPKSASQFRKSWYPERLYLLTDRCMENDIKTYARQLGASHIVICNLDAMGRDFDFYKDPQSLESFSIFTDKPIPKDCIEIKRLRDFYN